MRESEMENIDECLESEGQEAMRQLVKAMPEDSLSMAWRSSLNEKIVASAVKQKRRRWFLNAMIPSVGMSVACGLALLVLARTPAPTTVSGRNIEMEKSMLSAHRMADVSSDVAGAGLAPSETADVTKGSAGSDWNDEADVETL